MLLNYPKLYNFERNFDRSLMILQLAILSTIKRYEQIFF